MSVVVLHDTNTLKQLAETFEVPSQSLSADRLVDALVNAFAARKFDGVSADAQLLLASCVPSLPEKCRSHVLSHFVSTLSVSPDVVPVLSVLLSLLTVAKDRVIVLTALVSKISPEDLPQFLEDHAAVVTQTAQSHSELFRAVYASLPASCAALRLEYLLKFLVSVKDVTAFVVQEANKKLVVELVQQAIQLPSFLNFDELSQLSVVTQLASFNATLHSLLNIFVSEDLTAFDAFVTKNKASLAWLEMTSAREKMTLLTLATFAYAHLGQSVSYASIQSLLQTNDIEFILMSALRHNLLECKINQATQTIHITKAAPRRFTKEEWTHIESNANAIAKQFDSLVKVIDRIRKEHHAVVREFFKKEVKEEEEVIGH